MKTNLKQVLLGLCLLSITAHAQSVRSLKTVMNENGNSLKVIMADLQANTLDASTSAEADKFVAQIVEAETIVPDGVLHMPKADQDAAKAKYLSEMKQAEDLASKFRDAIKAGNATDAKALLVKLVDIKKQGHQDFKK